MEDYETDIIEVWPDNQQAYELFRRVGTRWRFRPGGGMGPPPVVPLGLEWPAIYPMLERLGLSSEDWNDLHDALMVMEAEAIETMAEFAPKL